MFSMLITDGPITDLESNCKKNSIPLSALSLSWIETELWAEEIGKVVGLIWMRSWMLTATVALPGQRKMSTRCLRKIILSPESEK